MDRGRYRALLRNGLLSGVIAAGCLAVAAPLRAQQPGNASPVPSVAVPPAAPSPGASATPDAVTRKRAAERMIERRQREQAAGEQETQQRIDRLPPEERESFRRNLKLWRELSPAERETVRKDESERMREEIEKTFQQTGLHLNKDQQEVFALRYRQERRRLERELQQKLEAERARRLPGLVEGLKKEFADRAAATPIPAVSASPSAKPPAPSVTAPAPPPAAITHPGG